VAYLLPNSTPEKNARKYSIAIGLRISKEGTQVMKNQVRKELESELRRRRLALLQNVGESDEDIRAIAEERESELEESAQKDRLARLTSSLKERDQRTIAGIDAALDRMAAGVYGKCEDCGGVIGVNRLRALPMTNLCIDCASAREKRRQPMSPGKAAEPLEQLRIPARDIDEGIEFES
jgi:DnaK suppressor protein